MRKAKYSPNTAGTLQGFSVLASREWKSRNNEKHVVCWGKMQMSRTEHINIIQYNCKVYRVVIACSFSGAQVFSFFPLSPCLHCYSYVIIKSYPFLPLAVPDWNHRTPRRFCRSMGTEPGSLRGRSWDWKTLHTSLMCQFQICCETCLVFLTR